MTLEAALTKLYMRHMIATPRGRAHILNQIADAEDNGEARVFDDALALVDDPKLAKMIEKHRDDEIRHGRLFRSAMARTGVDPGPVPDSLKVLDRIDHALGQFFQRPLESEGDVLTAYLVLQVIEERAIEEFRLYEPIFRRVDPETADLFRAVARDEERHLKYCKAISKRYAPDEATIDRELARLRRIEAQAFRDTQLANMEYVHEHRIMENRLIRGFWRALSKVGTANDPLHFETPRAASAAV